MLDMARGAPKRRDVRNCWTRA